MQVFVLGTGRCGSTTFANACGHLTNFSAAHESRAHKSSLEVRLAYPDQHIEVDNRLTWFLAPLADRYPDAFYVHLTRNYDDVVESFVRRWDKNTSNIVRSFAQGILIRTDNPGPAARQRIARMYVDTVTETISSFLRTREHMRIELENVHQEFPRFLNRIDARGDHDAAMAEWLVRHNASPTAEIAKSGA